MIFKEIYVFCKAAYQRQGGLDDSKIFIKFGQIRVGLDKARFLGRFDELAYSSQQQKNELICLNFTKIELPQKSLKYIFLDTVGTYVNYI